MNTLLYRSILSFAYDVIQVNSKTKQAYIIKENGKLSDNPDVPVNASEYLQNYLKKNPIHPSDLWELDILSDPELLVSYFQGGIGTSMILRHIDNKNTIWRRVEVFLAEGYSEDNPYFFVLSQNLGEAEATFFDSYSEMSKRFHKILRVNLQSNEVGFVHEEDVIAFRRHMSPEYIKMFFSRGNSIMNFYYRRKIGALFRWTKMAINTKDYSDSYYENLMSVVSGFTQHYVDFYMIDLEKDLYIQYKAISGLLPDAHDMVGSYSEMSISYIENYCSEEQAKTLRNYCTSEKLICRTVHCDNPNQLHVRTFGNFEVFYPDGTPLNFTRKLSRQLLAYLIDKQGYPVTSKDIVFDILEKPADDINAIKYVSKLIRRAIDDLEKAGFPDIIIKEQKTVRINAKLINCDYYNLLKGDYSYLLDYHNEYMKKYSWAESTNAEVLSMVDK